MNKDIILQRGVFMINTITIATYIGVAVICAIIFGIYGYKKGWKGGLSVFGISLTATIFAYISAPAVSGMVGDMSLITDLTEKGYTAAEGIGLGKRQLSVVLEKSIDKVLEIPVALILFIIFFIIFAVAAFIIRKVMKCSKGKDDLKSKIIGLSLAAVSIPLVLLFTFLVGKINIFEETKRADTVMELTSKPENQLIEDVLHNNSTYTDIFFETKVIDADEKTRLYLINDVINGAVRKIDDNLFYELYDFPGYETRTALNTDLTTIDELYSIAVDNKLLEEGSLLQKVFEIQDKKTVVDKIYSLKFRDILLRYILTISVRRVISDENYIYPADISFDGTEEEILMILDIAQKVQSGEMSKIEAAKQLVKSPLVPRDVISTVIEENISKVVGENLAEKVTKYIEKHRILEKIADSELPVEEVVEFIEGLQGGKILDEVKLEELKEYVENSGILDDAGQGNSSDIQIDQDILDAIKDNDFSDISIDEILDHLGALQ